MCINLGPINVLNGLINENFDSDPDRSYLAKEYRISQLTESKHVHKSAAIAPLQTSNENKSCLTKSFWCQTEGSEN